MGCMQASEYRGRVTRRSVAAGPGAQGAGRQDVVQPHVIRKLAVVILHVHGMSTIARVTVRAWFRSTGTEIWSASFVSSSCSNAFSQKANDSFSDATSVAPGRVA